MDKKTPFERLDEIRVNFFKKLTTESAFALKIGASKQTWSTWKGPRGLSKQAIPRIVDKLRENGVLVSTDYLHSGRGEKPRFGNEPVLTHEDIHIRNVIALMESADSEGRLAAYCAVRDTLRERVLEFPQPARKAAL